MATLTVNRFLDAAACTAGEAMTIDSGAVLTVRTDYRVHANTPASNTGSLGSVTINEGKFIWDSTAVRWMPYSGGGANVPIVGTTISQGGVSGYLLGCWASKTSAQTAVGAASPATGFLKFREVTGGSFASGAITGFTGLSATGPDVQGWISLPHDAAANFTVPRLGEHRARGGRFFLENTTGSVAQVFQVPTDGSAGMYAPGLWVETGVASDVYEYWPGLFSATNGWAHQHIGEAQGYSDKRQNFVKILAGGQLQMGEAYTQASTYVSLAAQASTHAEISQTSTYTWVNNKVVVYNATAHGLVTGMQTGIDFTSGGATADGIYTITVESPYHFSFTLAGSGASGACTSKPGITVTFTAHGLNIGESVYCDFTSGTPVDGTYEIYAVPSTGTYLIKYPHVAALTSGAVSVLHTLVVTFTAHGMALGNKVYLDFTSGAGVDGLFTIKSVPDANSYRVNFPHSAAITSSNVTMRRQIGNVAPSGCRTWIPSNILNEVATGARATNTVPNTTQASRPEWITTAAGAIDLEYVYGCSGFPTFAQAYSLRLENCAFFDQIIISEIATPMDLDHCNVSMQGAMDLLTLSLISNFTGGTINNSKFHRGNAPGTSDHAVSINYCKNLNFNNCDAGIIQYARNSGYPCFIQYSDNCEFNSFRTLNGNINMLGVTNIDITNFDYCDRFTGRTNATTTYYGVVVGAGSANILIDGVTFGYNNTIQDCHPCAGVVQYIASQNVKIRNIGTSSVPLNGGTWAPNTYGCNYLTYSSGNNSNVKTQRCYMDKTRGVFITPINSDKNMVYESIFCGFYVWSTMALQLTLHTDLNGEIRGCLEVNGTTGQSSVYGTQMYDIFMGPGYGRYVIPFNEPTVEFASLFTMDSGTAKFNSSGGLLLAAVGNQATWTDANFRLGHTGFDTTEVLLSGPTQTRYSIYYQIDTGSGFGAWHNLYFRRLSTAGVSGEFTFSLATTDGLEVGDYIWGTGRTNIGRITQINGLVVTSDVANSASVTGSLRFNHLPFETISPSTGFKLKTRLYCETAETVACAFLRIDTLSTAAAQAANLYPLDTSQFTFNVVDSALASVTNYEYRIYLKDPAAGILGTTELAGSEVNAVSSYTLNHTYSANTDIVLQILKDGFEEYTAEYTINSTPQTVKAILSPEYNI